MGEFQVGVFQRPQQLPRNRKQPERIPPHTAQKISAGSNSKIPTATANSHSKNIGIQSRSVWLRLSGTLTTATNGIISAPPVPE
jgi:hypothetical protein